MKLLVTIILSFFLAKGCSNYKELENVKVEYIANTRGFHQSVKIEHKKFWLTNERDGEPVEIQLTDAQWKTLSDLFVKIDLDTFETLEGETKERTYDKKPFANLHITKKDKEYKTLGFDHTIPPNEIKSFVDLILKYANE
jgi:hypothetical protein